MKAELQRKILDHLDLIIKRLLIRKSTRQNKIVPQLIMIPLKMIKF